mmetsp:Transcript_31290/g.71439  ORF Transcript_31290/g.71439 Transcript_31290/m.71439 type:complete len:319 (+) Transcript_31290:64-1020(+)
MGQKASTYCCQEDLSADQRLTWELLPGVVSSSSMSRPQDSQGPQSRPGRLIATEEILLGEHTGAADFSMAASDEDRLKRPMSQSPFEAYDPRKTCCTTMEDEMDHTAYPLEALSYTPVRFDHVNSMDLERSHARYSKIAVHSTHARTQRRSKAWEEWLKATTVGRSVILLTVTEKPQGSDVKGAGEAVPVLGSGGGGTAELSKGLRCDKVPAMYSLDRSLTTLVFVPHEPAMLPSMEVPIDRIQVICPVSDFMVFCDQVDTCLDEAEKARAVLLQYHTDDSVRKRVCFLEGSEQAKDLCVQALTTLWLEKRNNHSMWF